MAPGLIELYLPRWTEQSSHRGERLDDSVCLVLSPISMMIRPSEVWKDYGSWEAFHEKEGGRLSRFANIQFSKIAEVASRLNSGKQCVVTPGRFAFGGLNVVVEVGFEDDVVWLCRVGWANRPGSEEFTDKYVEAMMESTVTTMRYLKSHSSLPIPEIYAYESKPSASELGAVYIFIEPLPGRADLFNKPLAEKSKETIELELKAQETIAYVTAELCKFTFPAIGWLRETKEGITVAPFVDYDGTETGPFTTSLEYFKSVAKNTHRLHANSQGTSKETQFACWLYEQLAAKMDDYNSGPFPLMHPDFGDAQLLFTDDLNLTGVLDFDGIGTVPWLLVSCFPPGVKINLARDEQEHYNPAVLAQIRNNRISYELSLRKHAELGAPVERVVSLLEHKRGKVDMADLLVYFSDPYYKYDGKKAFEYLFPDSSQSMEEFRENWERERQEQVFV